MIQYVHSIMYSIELIDFARHSVGNAKRQKCWYRYTELWLRLWNTLPEWAIEIRRHQESERNTEVSALAAMAQNVCHRLSAAAKHEKAHTIPALLSTVT